MNVQAGPLPVDDQDLWVEVRLRARGPLRPALFVDRDGSLIEEVAFPSAPEHVRVIAGAAGAVTSARAANWLVVLATNQSGVGRGFLNWSQFSAVQEELIRQLREEGAEIDMVVACPHHPEGIGRFAHPSHPARKPGAGMLHLAARHLPIDLPRSVIVGDRASDIAAGRAAGLSTGYLVQTGYGRDQTDSARSLETTGFKVKVLPSIADWRPSLAKV